MSIIRHNQFPTERDFDPWCGCLDAQCAWRHFGGLTLEQAHSKFLESPLCYQEDFMWMGGSAFVYYFPVIEEYLKSVPEGLNEDDAEAWILSCGIKMQFECGDIQIVRPLIPRILALADFIQANIDRFGNEEEGSRVREGWSDLVAHLKAIE